MLRTFWASEARIAFNAMLERERLGATGMGHGVAIPHARIAGLKGIVGHLCSPAESLIEFEAVDDEPVDLVFALLAPEDAGADHLAGALARRVPPPA